ncbi:MAG TPA: efflux RND transporter periplasmic adaptor subunit [Opitutaceae bacterium]|nr:efflux RND transporter periplasmic adaptor subunit [Opitutaceae bacterium]
MTSPKPTLDDLRIARSANPEGPKRILPAVLAIGALVVAAALVTWWSLPPRTIAVHAVMAREVTRASGDRTVLNASGYVTARREATVSSKVTGKVTEVLVEEGMKVKEGQVLARLDDTNVKASLLLARAQLASATAMMAETRVRLKEAGQELQRQTDLTKGQVATKADYDHAEAAALAFRARLEQQQADVEVASRTVEIWQQQLDDTVIRAPFAGIATSKNAQPGEMISPISAGGGFTRTGICTVVDMDSLEIEIDVNESYINRVEPGQAVEGTLDAYPEWKIPCHVIAIIPTADREKSTVRVRVGFDKLDPRILPEMSVKVGFRGTGEMGVAAGRSVLVPQAAIRQQDGRDVVLVIRDGRVERRAVSVVNTQAGESEIGAGLSGGERVVVEGPAGLADGAAVKEINP